jgi:hypothetical protein
MRDASDEVSEPIPRVSEDWSALPSRGSRRVGNRTGSPSGQRIALAAENLSVLRVRQAVKAELLAAAVHSHRDQVMLVLGECCECLGHHEPHQPSVQVVYGGLTWRLGI